MNILSGKSVFNETERFRPYFIALSEALYGYGFQSPGATELLDEICRGKRLEGASVLDLGTGCGGNALYFQRRSSGQTVSIDINEAFLDITRQRAEEEGLLLSLRNQSVLDLQDEALYDLAFGRDVLMYVNDKPRALARLWRALKPGGNLLIVDYCRRAGDISDGYACYIDNGNYQLNTLDQYYRQVRDAGFDEVTVVDITDRYISWLQASLDVFRVSPFLPDHFEQKDIDYIIERTENKLSWCREGSMVWGLIEARV